MTQLTQIATEMNIRNVNDFANLIVVMHRAHGIYGNIKMMNEIDAMHLTRNGMSAEDAAEFIDAFKTESEFRNDFLKLALRHQAA